MQSNYGLELTAAQRKPGGPAAQAERYASKYTDTLRLLIGDNV